MLAKEMIRKERLCCDQRGTLAVPKKLLLPLWMFRSMSDIPYTFPRRNLNIKTTSYMKRMLHIILNRLLCLIFCVCRSGMLIGKENECGKKSWFANVFATLELTIHNLHLQGLGNTCPWRFPLKCQVNLQYNRTSV